MDAILQDLRYAVRTLLKSPGFTGVAVLTLALAIGGTTAVLSLANALFFRALPIPEAERVVAAIQHLDDGTPWAAVSYPEYLAYREGTESVFLALAASGNRTFGLRTEAGAEPVAGLFVTGNYFSMLRVQAAAGRLISLDDDAAGSAAVAVLSHEAWQRRFGGDPAVVGRTVHLDGHALTVVGVAAETFRGTEMTTVPEVWVPIASREFLAPGTLDGEGRRIVWLTMHGRLRDGVSAAQAEAALSVVGRNHFEGMPAGQRVERVSLNAAGGVPTFLQGTLASLTGILLIASGLVFLIAATNVAGMLLARASTRRRETAIRLAMGAGRRRLVRQALTESGVLFLLGAAAGVLVAFWLTRLAGAFLFTQRSPIPLVNLDATPDAGVLIVAIALALAAGLAFGLAPAAETLRADLTPALKNASAGAGRRRSTLRSAMVVAQVTMSLVLLVGAGLFMRSLQEAARVDLGLDPTNVLSGRLALQAHGYDPASGIELYRQLAERVEALPGVQRVSFADSPPLSNMEVTTGLAVGGGDPVQLWYNPVSTGYFETLGIPLVRGRLFDATDRAGAPEVAVVNESFVRHHLAGGDAVGTTVRMTGAEVEIVGVVRDSRWSGLEDEGRPFAYRPLEQDYAPVVSMMVRSAGDAAPLEAAIRREIHALDPDLPLTAVATLEDAVRALTLPQRVAAWAASGFGVVGLLLALVGLYGVLAYTVGQRTREIGVRVALGAPPPVVVGLVLRQGLGLVGIGMLLGIGASVALQPAIRDLLLGVAPTDPVVMGGVVLLMTLVALAASFFPARRASRVDPIVALRAE